MAEENGNLLRAQVLELKAEIATLKVNALKIESPQNKPWEFIKLFGIGGIIVSTLFLAGVNYATLQGNNEDIATVAERQRDVRERLSAIEAQNQELTRRLNEFDHSDERFLPRTRIN